MVSSGCGKGNPSSAPLYQVMASKKPNTKSAPQHDNDAMESAISQCLTGLGLNSELVWLREVAQVVLSEFEALRSAAQRNADEKISLKEEVRKFEMLLIRIALLQSRGHQVRAARYLGISPTNLNNKLKQYGINVHDPVENI